MSDPEGPPFDEYPDVRTKPRTALLLITSLCGLYAVIFVALGVPSKTAGIDLYASFGLAASLLVLAYIDLRTGLLLDVITLPLIAAGIAIAALSSGAWVGAIVGALVGYGLIAGVGYIWRRLRGYEGIGLGDAKLLAAGGAWVGVAQLPVILLFASFLGLVMALIVSRNPQESGDQTAIPFGPALGLGIWIAWCADGFGVI